jgi:hypothetical protein
MRVSLQARTIHIHLSASWKRIPRDACLVDANFCGADLVHGRKHLAACGAPTTVPEEQQQPCEKQCE